VVEAELVALPLVPPVVKAAQEEAVVDRQERVALEVKEELAVRVPMQLVVLEVLVEVVLQLVLVELEAWVELVMVHLVE